MNMKQTKVSKPVDVDEDVLDEELDDVDADDTDEGEKPIQTALVSNFIRMWPREIFNTPEGDGRKGSIASRIDELKKPGVYILYRDDVPFYIGQTKKKLRSRLRTHASGVVSLKSYFWNYFSAYIVEDPGNIDEVEAILISAMPSIIMNSATPNLKKVHTRESIRKLMRELRKRG